jgi:hypothetical protein
VAELREDCERVTVNSTYRDDLFASLKELQVCFDHACYIACFGPGRKDTGDLMDHRIPFDDGWMIGKLLEKLKESRCPKYIDQSLDNVGRIINKSRIPAVHALERVPVPSKEQAVMVIHAVIDTVRRAIVAP